MKKTGKFLAVALAGISTFGALSTLSACGTNNGIVIDKTKTQLYVSNNNAGIGTRWVETIGGLFQEEFKNYSFETGKTGVQVIYDHSRVYTGTTLESNISSSTNNIFFTEGVDYPSLMTKELLYNVADLLKQPALTGVDENGNFTYEQTNLLEKVDVNFQQYLNKGTDTQIVYGAVPYGLMTKGFIFDKDLWHENSYYLAKAATPAELVVQALENNGDVEAAKAQYKAEIAKLNAGQQSGYWTLVNEEGVAKSLNNMKLGLSAGPDGKYNTYDDGMPATLDEFYLLMDTIVASNVTPFIFTGKFPGYGDVTDTNVWINYEGKDNINTFYSLTGTSDELVVLDSNGNIQYNDDGSVKTESKTFDGGTEDGYELQRQLGKLYALQFAEKMAMSADWLAPECDNGAISHIAAQTKFLASCVGGAKRIAMLGDGAWWMQESDDTFAMMESNNAKYSKKNRNLAMLNAPNATIDRLAERYVNNEKNLLLAQNHSFMFINGNLSEGNPQLAVAKAFFSYVNSDKMLNKFTELTSMFRAMKYKIDDETYGKLTQYAKNLKHQMEDSEIIYPYTKNELVNKNFAYLEPSTLAWNWHTKTYSGVEAYYPITSLRNSSLRNEGLSAATYFTGLYNYHKNTVWERLI